MFKPFSIVHFVENVSKMEESKVYYSEKIERFNVPWRFYFQRINNGLAVYLYSEKFEHSTTTCMAKGKLILKMTSTHGRVLPKFANFDLDIILTVGGFGVNRLADWNTVKQYLVNDRMILEVEVAIEKMDKVVRKKNWEFDESTKEFSNVILDVGGEKFYVSKEYLAMQSSYFKSLLLGPFTESKQSEVTLKDIDPEDFQTFLELIHMEPALSDSCIDSVLVLADMYGAKNAIRVCEEFLIKDSKHSMKLKIRIAAQFKLENLKKHVIGSMKTTADIRSVLGDALEELDKAIQRELLEKSLMLQ